MSRPRIRSAILSGSIALACCASPNGATLPDAVIDLRPTPAGSTAGRSLLPASWTRPRILEIATSPPGAALDLFYLRENVQLRFARADAPARVAIPACIDASTSDAVLVRAALDGHRVTERWIDPNAVAIRHTIELAALPNRVLRFAYRDLSGRATLFFTTREPSRFQLHEESSGFRIVLPETALESDVRPMFVDLASELVERVEPIPVGEDLVVRVTLRSDASDPRAPPRGRRWRDPGGGSSGFAIEVGATVGDDARIARLRSALAAASRSDVSGCALEWERSIRAALDPSRLARALGSGARDGDEAFRHEAMRRLGHLSENRVVRSVRGSAYRVDREIETLAATSLASEIAGFLALLRSASAHLAGPGHRTEALRGLIAPAMDVARWNALVAEAERNERTCLASTAH